LHPAFSASRHELPLLRHLDRVRHLRDHPHFSELGTAERRLATLLYESDRIEEVMPESPHVDVQSAVVVAAEAKLCTPRPGLTKPRVLVVSSRPAHLWAQAWAAASGTEWKLLTSAGGPPSLARIRDYQVNFIDAPTLSQSFYGKAWADEEWDLVISHWPQVLSNATGKRYLASARLRSESRRSWVVAPSIPTRASFTLGEPGRYLTDLTVGRVAHAGPRSRPSGLALGQLERVFA
jgi:hypothetical protein